MLAQSRRPTVRPSRTRAHRRPVLILLGMVDRRAGSAAADRAGERALPLSTVATVALPGHGSRFDYADLDAAVYRLFLAHMEDGTLLELDTRTTR